MTIMGVYIGNDPAELDSYNAWLGRDVDAVHGVVGAANWTDFVSSADWMTTTLWKGIDESVLWSVPLIVTDGTASLAEAAGGNYNSHYQSVAESLLASRAGDSDPIYIRTGWELNGDWFAWSAVGHEADFIGAYRQFVDSFRDVSDRFKFEWNVNYSEGGIDPASAYPGDAYVDVVGMDFYWTPEYQGSDPLAAWNAIVGAQYGLQWVEDFAAAHGKSTAYSEWGVNSDNAAAYLAEVKAWFADHDVAYESYWDMSADKVTGLSDGSMPTAAAAFQDIFGGTTDTGDAVSAPTPAAPTEADTIVTDPILATLVLSGASTNFVWGTGDSNILVGTAGNDRIASLGGNDWMAGGQGDDTYVVYSGTEQIVEKAGEGIDTVTTWIGQYTLPDHVENLIVTGTGWTQATGNSLDNIITGNDGPNVIDGKGGNDVLAGGGGSDTFVIAKGAGFDTITDFHLHAMSGDADTLQFQGFGTGADMHNVGDLFTVTADDGTVEHFTLSGVTALAANDYAFT
jgi:Ca2+-binding RTX toxin-like protein